MGSGRFSYAAERRAHLFRVARKSNLSDLLKMTWISFPMLRYAIMCLEVFACINTIQLKVYIYTPVVGGSNFYVDDDFVWFPFRSVHDLLTNCSICRRK